MTAESKSAAPAPALRNRSGGVVALESNGAIRTMQIRREFLAANRGRRAPTPAFVLLVHHRGDGESVMGVGYTVTKRTGNAVVRNRIKRRFRALAAAVLTNHGITGADHVLIGRKDALTRDFEEMRKDLEKALQRVRKPRK